MQCEVEKNPLQKWLIFEMLNEKLDFLFEDVNIN